MSHHIYSTMRCLVHPLRRGLAPLRRSLVSGKATREGTAAYVKQSGIELFHKLEKANLLITPIIHGPPALVINGPNNDSNVALIQALLYNKSNAVYVYNHYTRGPWYSSQVATLVENGLAREGVVCIADLGYAAKKEELARRLQEAAQLAGLTRIDFAIVRANEYHLNMDEKSVGAALLNESIGFLESVCAQDALSSYGLRVDVAPYNLHTPLFEDIEPDYESGGSVPTLELSLIGADATMRYCDALFYETSPSTAFPASYSVLRASEQDMQQYPDTFEETDIEKERTHSRIAVNPLTCYNGWGDGPESARHFLSRRRNHLDEYLAARGYDRAAFTMFSTPAAQRTYHDQMVETQVHEALVTLCPKLKSSRLLQEKALRLVLSIGHDACVVDSDLSAALGKFSLTVRDVLSPADSEQVFGQFQVIPEMMRRIEEGGVEEGDASSRR